LAPTPPWLSGVEPAAASSPPPVVPVQPRSAPQSPALPSDGAACHTDMVLVMVAAQPSAGLSEAGNWRAHMICCFELSIVAAETSTVFSLILRSFCLRSFSSAAHCACCATLFSCHSFSIAASLRARIDCPSAAGTNRHGHSTKPIIIRIHGASHRRPEPTVHAVGPRGPALCCAAALRAVLPEPSAPPPWRPPSRAAEQLKPTPPAPVAIRTCRGYHTHRMHSNKRACKATHLSL
jgi:hypothetical protein